MFEGFTTKKELFEYLVKNKEEHIRLKKNIIKTTDSCFARCEKYIQTKGFDYTSNDDVKKGIITRAIVGNTYNWMDSHNDVHIDGTFTKSILENKSKILHLHDHINQLVAKVGRPIDVFEQKMNWVDLGVKMLGTTTVLIMISEIRKDYNIAIFNQYLNSEINQHSVGMQYVKLSLAIDDNEYEEEKIVWDTYVDRIANKQKAIDTGYFWAVQEAKLLEISAVISGSNEITPTLEPQKSTLNEPDSTTKVDFEYLITNFKL
jgi:hypothetical protein